MYRHDRDSSTSAELLPVTTPSPNSPLATLVDAIPIVSPDERTSMCSGLPARGVR
jgi:hypothetical protein